MIAPVASTPSPTRHFREFGLPPRAKSLVYSPSCQRMLWRFISPNVSKRESSGQTVAGRERDVAQLLNWGVVHDAVQHRENSREQFLDEGLGRNEVVRG